MAPFLGGDLKVYFGLQEYLSSECVSSDSLMELSNVSWSRSILNMAECTQRKLVTALSQHVTYGKAVAHITVIILY